MTPASTHATNQLTWTADTVRTLERHINTAGWDQYPTLAIITGNPTTTRQSFAYTTMPIPESEWLWMGPHALRHIAEMLACDPHQVSENLHPNANPLAWVYGVESYLTADPPHHADNPPQLLDNPHAREYRAVVAVDIDHAVYETIRYRGTTYTTSDVYTYADHRAAMLDLKNQRITNHNTVIDHLHQLATLLPRPAREES